MVRLLLTLSEEMKARDIYVWNVDKDSITEFTKLAFRQIDVKGFVTQEETCIGERYMNRPVVAPEEVLGNENAVIILSEKCNRGRIPEAVARKSYLLSELLQIDEELKKKSVYIYGTGAGAKEMFHQLKNSGIEIEAFCVTSKENANRAEEGKRVYQVDETVHSDNNAYIISPFNLQYQQEMISVLDSYTADIYIRDFFNDDILLVISLFQSLHKAWSEQKKIYVYTKTMGGYLQLIKKTLELYGLKISGYVCKDIVSLSQIRDVYDLTFETIENSYVLINDLDILNRKEQIEVYQILESIGFSVSAFNYAAFHPVTTKDWNGKDQNTPDPLVGWSMVYEDRDYPGVHVLGNRDENDIRIVVLGGSTSTDGILRVTSWVRLFYRKLRSSGHEVTIYNCAGAGEDVLQEFLRLIRDGVHFRPHYVISMSGVNNRVHMIRGVPNKANLKHTVEWFNTLAPDSACVCGIPVREDAFSYWLRIQKIMKATAELNNSRFFCFLQPIKEAKKTLSLFERSVHYSGDTDNEAASFRENARNDDFYINLLSLFDEKEEMFTDICHYSEAANEILAEIVYQELLKDFAETHDGKQ